MPRVGVLSGERRFTAYPRPDRPPSGRAPSGRPLLRPPAGGDRPGPDGLEPGAGRSDAAAEVTLLAVTLAAAAGLDRVFNGHGWVVPVVCSAVVAHGVAWATRRLRLLPGMATLLGLIAVVLVTTWTVLGSTTVAGLPLGHTWSAVNDALANARRVLPAVSTPAPDLDGFRLVAASTVGVVALLGDWAAFRMRSALQALLPAFAVFVVCSVLGTTGGRVWAVAAMVATMAVFVVVHRTTVGWSGAVWFGGMVPRRPGRLIGVAVATVAVAGAVAAVALLPAAEGHGPLGWRHGPGGSGARSVVSPIVDLRTRLLFESDTPVMTVSSPVASYWRLTSLDTFTGVQWQSTNSYLDVGRRLPGVGPPPPNTRQVDERFHLQDLESIWLPAAFYPESVIGGGQVTYDPVSGSLLTSRATANGLSYRVVSLQYLATLSTRALEAAPSPTGAALMHDLALPALPPEFRALAQRITAGKSTEYDKALALQNYFYGPQFRYSLSPPTDGYGSDALGTFLFETKTGYCQQFAGAYAVLARSIGLPTRLAVGFTTGSPKPAGTFQVTDGDAHTWPEVYFAGYGWLPFEPTKGGFEIPGATGYTGPTATGPSSSALPAPASVSGTEGLTPADPTAPPTIPTRPAPAAAAAHRVSANHFPTAEVVAGGVLALLVLWPVAISAGRRLRWQRRRAAADRGPAGPGAVLAWWAVAEELLAWWGLRRAADETFTELAHRAALRLPQVRARPAQPRRQQPAAQQPASTPGWEDLGTLAAWATEADYAGGALQPGSLEGARRAREAIGVGLHGAAPLRRRLTWLADPRLAWRGTISARCRSGAATGARCRRAHR